MFCGLKNKPLQHLALVLLSQMGMWERLAVDFLTWDHFGAQHEYPLMEETKETCVLELCLITLVCWHSMIINQYRDE